jgi:hypothetical protein
MEIITIHGGYAAVVRNPYNIHVNGIEWDNAVVNFKYDELDKFMEWVKEKKLEIVGLSIVD